MDVIVQRALQNAAASSAMEGLPLEQRHLEIIQDILGGKLTLEDYLQSLCKKEAETDNTVALHSV